ncbi:MAG: flagellar protein FlaG [Desulfobacterales bacterium]|nr:flagellar protein FlaG [Desulfobacterales bacterium]
MAVSITTKMDNLFTANVGRPVTSGSSDASKNEKASNTLKLKATDALSKQLSLEDSAENKAGGVAPKNGESKDKVKSALDELNNKLKEYDVSFSYNDDAEQMVVNIKSKKTGDVIRTVPPDFILKMNENFKNMGKVEGMILSQHA